MACDGLFLMTMMILTLGFGSPSSGRLQAPTSAPVDDNVAAAVVNVFKTREQRIKAFLDRPATNAEYRDRLKNEINGIFDFATMARAALGSTWSDLSAAQQNAFVDAFAALVRENSVRNLDIYRADITYLGVESLPDGVRLNTRATYKDKQTSVAYILYRDDQGNWRVTDFLLDNVSTIEAYRKSFARIIRKHGFDGLMARIQKKVAKLKNMAEDAQGSEP